MSDWLRYANYVPFWKRQDPTIQDFFGHTLAMDWIFLLKQILQNGLDMI